ncbi:MAG TPA: CBS domain-containing protein [Coleofasciculaceae cyanobacterium]|jgi:acetoin utilization protein AcuB
MRVKDFMITDVKSASSNETAEAAWSRMQKNHIRHLVVIDDGRIIGMISERDLGRFDEGWQRERMLVRDVMTKNVITAESEMNIREAANLMRGSTIDCLPIVEQGELVGLITTTDLLELLGKGSDREIMGAHKKPVR